MLSKVALYDVLYHFLAEPPSSGFLGPRRPGSAGTESALCLPIDAEAALDSSDRISKQVLTKTPQGFRPPQMSIASIESAIDILGSQFLP